MAFVMIFSLISVIDAGSICAIVLLEVFGYEQEIKVYCSIFGGGFAVCMCRRFSCRCGIRGRGKSYVYKYTTKVLACAELACGTGIAMHGVKNIVSDNTGLKEVTNVEKIVLGLEVLMGTESILELSEMLFK